MQRRLGAVVAWTVVVVLLAAACGSSGKSSNSGTAATGGAKAGGTLRLGMSGTTGSLDPFSGLQGEYRTFTAIYPTLVSYDLKTLDLKPNFAEKWETSPDQKTWTFHTRTNGKWSDGQPLTARDAAFTLGTIVKFQKGATANYSSYVSHLQSADAPDPTTLVLRYESPVGNALAQAGTVQLLPEHVWGQFATGDGSALKTFANTPDPGKPTVSGGPFILTEQKKDEIEQFSRNPGYYGTKPLIDGFGVRFFANDDALVTALKNGDIDAIEGVPATAVDALKAAGLTVKEQPSDAYNGLIVNSSSQKAKNRELLDPNVRQAFEQAIDRNKVVQIVSSGHAEPGASIVPPALGKFYDSSLQPRSFDPAKANQLLDTAGFARGSDGTRVANGHPMAYEVLIQPTEDRLFQIVQSGLADVGVKVTARALDAKAEFAAIKANNYSDFDLALGSGTTGGYDPDFGLSAFACFARGLFNRTGYCNADYDALYKQQSTAAPAERTTLIHTMLKKLYDDQPLIVFTHPAHLDAWNNNWTGFAETVEGIYTFQSIETLTGVHRKS